LYEVRWLVAYPALQYLDLISIDPLQRLLAFTSQLLDDEMQSQADHPNQSGNYGQRLATGTLPREWRRRWRETEVECERLQRELRLLALRHPLRYLVNLVWRRTLASHRARRERRVASRSDRIARS
jgi:hypothetical protein